MVHIRKIPASSLFPSGDLPVVYGILKNCVPYINNCHVYFSSSIWITALIRIKIYRWSLNSLRVKVISRDFDWVAKSNDCDECICYTSAKIYSFEKCNRYLGYRGSDISLMFFSKQLSACWMFDDNILKASSY